MASIPGAVPVGGFFAPTDSTDTYPVTDPTWGLGGLRTVANLTERDAITTARREEGMAVYVISETKRYVLQGGITNAHWVHDFSGGVTELSDLSDVNTSGVLEDQVLAYDAYTGTWTPATISAGASVLDDLADVSSAGATDGQFLSYNVSTGVWSPTTISTPVVPTVASDLTDIDTSGATQDQVLAYNSSSGIWSPATIVDVVGATQLSELSDVSPSGAVQDQVLTYNSSSGVWSPSTINIPSVYWDRTGTILSPVTSGDSIQVSASGQAVSLSSDSGISLTSSSSSSITMSSNSAVSATAVGNIYLQYGQFLGSGSFTLSHQGTNNLISCSLIGDVAIASPTVVSLTCSSNVISLTTSQITFTDSYQSGSTYSSSMKYSASTAEWNTFVSNFGDGTSLLGAINTAYSSGGGASQLSDLSDVDTSGAVQDQVLAYNSSSGMWTPATINSPTVPSVLSDLTDVDSSGATQGQFLSYNVSTGIWTPTSVSPSGVSQLSDLSDVETLGALEDQVLAYNTSSGTWTPATISSGALYLNDLLDVSVDGALQNNVLAYDVSSNSWIPSSGLGESYATTFSGSSISLLDGQDFTLQESSLFTTRGIGQELIISPSVSSGQVTIELYQDSSRLEKVYEHVIDLSDSSTYKDYETFGFTNSTTGILYGTLSCSAVAGGATANISVTASIISPTGSPTAPPSPYGDGIEDDGTGKPRVALATQSGLAFTSGDLYVKGDSTQPVYTLNTVNGVYVTGAVDTTTNQSISGNKMFNTVGLTPSAFSGPPTSGTYSAGAEILDSENIKWRCYSSGSPGTWELADNVVEETLVYSSDIASLNYGRTVYIELDVTGNAGNCLLLKIWARTTTEDFFGYGDDDQVPFRARIYPTTDYNGRDMIWQGLGIAKDSRSSGVYPGEASVFCETDFFDVDEAVVLYENDSSYQFGRISSKSSSHVNLDEPVMHPYSSYSFGVKRVLGVSEWSNVPWCNFDGNPENRNKILLEIRHDGYEGSKDFIFYAQALVLSTGIVR